MGQVSLELHAALLGQWLQQDARVAYRITAHSLPEGAALAGVVHQRHRNSLLLTWEHPDLPDQAPGERPPIRTPEATTLRLPEDG